MEVSRTQAARVGYLKSGRPRINHFSRREDPRAAASEEVIIQERRRYPETEGLNAHLHSHEVVAQFAREHRTLTPAVLNGLNLPTQEYTA
jgi:predicted DNA-binding WGR domain protein